MNEDKINLSKDLLPNGIGVISAEGYINNEGGQAIADAATELMDSGCSTLLIDLEGTRIINSIGVSILLEIMGLLQSATMYPERATATSELTGHATG